MTSTSRRARRTRSCVGAYRIVLEALSNAAKHAGAAHVQYQGRLGRSALTGSVVDDGVGIPDDAATGPGHLGLRAMQDRADVLGGQVLVAAADGGTTVMFELPLAAANCPDVTPVTTSLITATRSSPADLTRYVARSVGRGEVARLRSRRWR